MRDPNDTRDIGPRIGSPLWIFIAVVTVVGLGALALTMRSLPASGVVHLAGHRLFWVIAMLALIGELRPIVTPGKSHLDAGAASLTFCFAALLYWGLPAALLLRAATSLVVAVAGRRALFRAAFNVAQLTLSLAAAAGVLALAGIHPVPLRPWVPTGGELGAVGLAAAAYFACNFVLVEVAVAVHGRAPIVATLRKTLPYQAFVSLALLGTAPLVVVVMDRSALLVLLFLLPLIAIYANAAMSVVREHQALHDQLTGLPNRALLLRKTAEALAEAARSSSRAGFLLLDLDRFKEVNDTLGHPLGDGLLQAVARRLTRSVRPGDVVARLGGDEFAVLLPSVRTVTAAREVAARLRAAIAEPVRLEGMSFEIEASVGIALYPDDGTTVEVLLQRADVAMYLAKGRRSGVEVYTTRTDRHSPARLSLLGDLRRGIDQGEFELHYQPKVFLDGRGTAGMEALLRWRHPRRGLIRPAEFIPLAEQSFLMRDLTAHVVQAALSQASAWRLAGLPVQLSVNVSARDLLDVGLAATIQRELAAHRLPPEVLLLEVSERTLTSEMAEIAAGVSALHDLGIQLSLDDFGTGYSSLTRLRRMSIGEVKIDPSFITTLTTSPDNEMIVRSVVGLVRDLGIRSVAECVESPEAAAALRAMGCDAAQGQAFSGPLNAAAATAWLADDFAAHPPTGQLAGITSGAGHAALTSPTGGAAAAGQVPGPAPAPDSVSGPTGAEVRPGESAPAMTGASESAAVAPGSGAEVIPGGSGGSADAAEEPAAMTGTGSAAGAGGSAGSAAGAGGSAAAVTGSGRSAGRTGGSAGRAGSAAESRAGGSAGRAAGPTAAGGRAGGFAPAVARAAGSAAAAAKSAAMGGRAGRTAAVGARITVGPASPAGRIGASAAGPGRVTAGPGVARPGIGPLDEASRAGDALAVPSAGVLDR
jgi:diguanylate cyclase (GGDEF)-like protein